MNKQPDENQIADRLIQLLEPETVNTDPPGNDAVSDSLGELVEVAQLVRASADVDEIKPNPELRTLMIQEIESTSLSEKPKRTGGRRFWPIVAAVSAMAMLAVGLWQFDAFERMMSPMAKLEPAVAPEKRINLDPVEGKARVLGVEAEKLTTKIEARKSQVVASNLESTVNSSKTDVSDFLAVVPQRLSKSRVAFEKDQLSDAQKTDFPSSID